MSIRLANVSKDFGNTKVLSDISVEIEPGEFFVMVGHDCRFNQCHGWTDLF